MSALNDTMKELVEATKSEKEFADNEKVSAKIEVLKEAVKTGIPNKSYLMKQFLGDNKPGTPNGDRYQHAANNEEKRQLRQEWIKKKLVEGDAKYSKHTEVQHVNGEMGDYLPVGPLVKAEGGWKDPDAVKAARTLIETALKKGGQWVWEHPQTHRLEFLKLRRVHNSLRKDAWRKDISLKESVGAPDEVPPDDTKKKDPKKPGKADRENAAIIAQATKMRSDILNYRSSANELVVDNTKNDSNEFTWAQNDENCGKLKAALAAITPSSFSRKIIVEGVPELKKKYKGKEHELVTGLTQFVEEMKTPLQNLVDQQAMILEMKAAQSRVQGRRDTPVKQRAKGKAKSKAAAKK